MFHHHGIATAAGALAATLVFGLVFTYVCVCTFIEDTISD